jgi:hypothetical protein
MNTDQDIESMMMTSCFSKISAMPQQNSIGWGTCVIAYFIFFFYQPLIFNI